MNNEHIKKISDNIWEISTDYKTGMRVPARILSSAQLIDGIDNKVIDQLTNVACLPGIRKYAYCMPDGHMGYGFPIGGVAAFNVDEGIVSPGGIGFDINCGMRLIRTNLTVDDIKKKAEQLLEGLYRKIPSGVGGGGLISPNRQEFNDLMENGAKWCLNNGYATDDDIRNIENHGHIEGADHRTVSEKAVNRGIKQMGSLGSGNHYLEIEIVDPDRVYDKETALKFGLDRDNQALVAVHCGSRGFGHQIATDYLKVFSKSVKKYNLEVRDRELMAAPIKSEEGQRYISAMACAANAAFANRQLIVYGIREVFRKIFNTTNEELGLESIYDVAHNIAKFEKYNIDGSEEEVLVHRKGATRSFGPNRSEVPEKYRDIGQPVIVGGSMETGSALLVGTKTADDETFGSTLHGAGRVMSRMKAKKSARGTEIQKQMKERGISVKTGHMAGLAEEAGFAYKKIDDVVDAVDQLGISKKVARLYPILNIKG